MRKIVWKNLIGQQLIKDVLTSAIAKESIGHAYLFVGEDGVGKFQAAIELAMILNCRNSDEIPCGTCSSCRQILENKSTDFHILTPVEFKASHKKENRLTEDGWEYYREKITERVSNPYGFEISQNGGYTVDLIREFDENLMRGANDSRKNVGIIECAERLNINSANAMLKTLEEPPSNTVIILLSSRPQELLQTIRSRCQILRFGKIQHDDLTIALKSTGVESSEINTIVEYADGSISKALSLVGNINREHEKYANKIFEQLLSDSSDLSDIDLIEEFIMFATSENNSSEFAIKSLKSLSTRLRRYFFASFNNEEKYIFGNGEKVSNDSKMSIGKLEKLYNIIEESIYSIRLRTNLRLIMVNLFAEFKEIV